jgi:hypothetical protein
MCELDIKRLVDDFSHYNNEFDLEWIYYVQLIS